MRWRPTLAALVTLALSAALLVAMSSASTPSVAPPEDSTPPVVDTTVEPPSSPPVEPAAAAPAVAPVTPGDAGANRDGSPTIPTDLVAAPDFSGGYPTVAADSSTPFEPSDIFDATRLIELEESRALTAEEIEEILSVPVATESAAEPLGRPARKIKRGPSGAPGEPVLYLTFDDGPNPTWTRPTLDLLDRYGARATFFTVGVFAELYPYLIDEIVARGHTLGSHLWTHQASALYDEDLFRQELRASAELLGDNLTNCLRPPYGRTNEEIFRWSGEEGFEIVLWGDVDPLDWSAPGTEVLTQRILNGIRPGTILLLHEHTGADTLRALDAVLAALAQAGWRFDQPICPLQF